MPPSPLALRLGGLDHALEPGRDYVLGTAPDCDLPLPAGAAPRHAALRIGAAEVTVEDLGGGVRHNGTAVDRAALQAGDVLALGPVDAVVVPDSGAALLVPLPALRTAARARRQAEVRASATSLLRRRDAESFAELMAQELRHAPWLGASLVLHVLLLLLLWWFAPWTEGGDAPRPQVNVVLTAEPPGPAAAQAPEVVIEPPVPEPTTLPAVAGDAEPTAEVPPPPDRDRGMPRSNPRLAPRASGGAGAGDGTLTAEVAGIGSAGFRRTVADLQSGLDIVFVFDSTGSMSRTIHDTRQTLAQMLTVLRALVPGARIGIVTYRDRGRREQYLVRTLPLGTDFWRASNFVQGIVADGGGDRPEDVRAGLRAAFAQRWQNGARRVVVLAGDAPPHEQDMAALLGDVRSFHAGGRASVHALVTSPEAVGQEARAAFQAIAAAGGGECLDLAAHERVLQRVLAFAFGREHDADVAAAIATVTAAAERVDAASLDLVHRGGPELAAALRADPVPTMLLQALARRPRRRVAFELTALLGEHRAPEHTRHAIAWVLQRVLELSAPPIDPETGAALDERALQRLRVACGTLPE
ncbi:MAG: VWA domain-containing protein [Planctomycetes bacterium]|nr:VWA domain-containing protein [Planctomycetota bacterium]